MNFSCHWPSWVVLLCVGMMPGGAGAVLAQDVPQAQPNAAPAPKAAPAVPQPASAKKSLLERLSDGIEAAQVAPRDQRQPARGVLTLEAPVIMPAPAAYQAFPPVIVVDDEEEPLVPPRPAPAPKAAPAPQPAAGKPSLLKKVADGIEAAQDGTYTRPVAAPVRPRPAAGKKTLLGKLADSLEINEDPNIRNLETQFRPQFQQLLYVELAFLRRVCNADEKPFVEVAQAAKPRLREAVREYAVSQNAMMRQGNPDRSDTIDPHSQVERLLAPLVESKLGPEQAYRYRQECDNRAEGRKHAAVLNVVAALDERLILTAEQRTKLVQSLSSAYQNSWEQWGQFFAMNAQYLPLIPDKSIAPVLNEKQLRVWQQVQKVNPRSFWNFQFARANMPGEAEEIREIARIVEEASDDQ